MFVGQSKISNNKVIIHITKSACDSPEELIDSHLFNRILKLTIEKLIKRNSELLNIFINKDHIDDEDIQKLRCTLSMAHKMPIEDVTRLVKGSDQFFRNTALFSDFIHYLHDSWRRFERFIICHSSEETMLEKLPYKTFHHTVEKINSLISITYRNLQTNISRKIVHQVVTGGEMAVIITKKAIPFKGSVYNKLNDIAVIRQICTYPPIVTYSTMHKRTGRFERVPLNPVDIVDIKSEDWLCYPAKVGHLIINIYFHERFAKLGFSLCNLFEIADDHELNKCPDAIYLFGVPGETLDGLAAIPTVFYDDVENDILVGAAPNDDKYEYFGYLKKMVLTLHNIRIMKAGGMPYHGAMTRIMLKGHKSANVLLIGDGGAGKSEMLAAFRELGNECIQDINIIADDMGSLSISEHNEILAYGTEIGAFVRLDDLDPGYVFSQIDKAIIMNPNKKNARALLPVTNLTTITKGYKVDIILYCNNYEEISERQPIIERFASPSEAIDIFRRGAVMSVGVSTSTGFVYNYFANAFGPAQYYQIHEQIAQKFFNKFFADKLFVGQMRTRLSLAGWEKKGPAKAAKVLFEIIQNGTW